MNFTQHIDFEALRLQFSMVAILSRLGYEPVRYSGGEHFYRSMLREGDRTPSFCVNDRLGVWFDHGLGKGGSIIDFAKDYWSIANPVDAAKKILDCMGEGTVSQRPFIPKQMEMILKFPNYIIGEDRPISENKKISQYIASRGLKEVAPDYLKVLDYSIKPEGKQVMNFSAAAWQNDSGGWELRNANFKGCLGNKGINFFQGDSDKIAVFEGMMDFLTWKTAFGKDSSSILVLNSLSLLPKAIAKLEHFAFIELFFDHDPAGRTATDKTIKDISHATDRSYLYQGYNDYNEMHQAQYKSRDQNQNDLGGNLNQRNR